MFRKKFVGLYVVFMTVFHTKEAEMHKRHKRSYGLDPYWTVAKFSSSCSKCGEKITKSTPIFYYPNTQSVLSGKCAEEASADFNLCKQDEDFYNSQYGGY